MINNRSMPQSTIIPALAYPNVEHAVSWLCQTFGFIERLRIGDHRAQLRLGGGDLIVMQRSNEPGQADPVTGNQPGAPRPPSW